MTVEFVADHAVIQYRLESNVVMTVMLSNDSRSYVSLIFRSEDGQLYQPNNFPSRAGVTGVYLDVPYDDVEEYVLEHAV